MTQADHAGVVAPPPLLYGIALALFLFLDWLSPAPILALSLTWPGAVLLAVGAGLNIWGAYTMIKARTPLNPYRPASAIVTKGPFRLTRNPLYMGFNLVFIGLALAINSLWGILALVPVVLVMHYGVILREERHLEEKFGEPYRQYCRDVGRYL